MWCLLYALGACWTARVRSALAVVSVYLTPRAYRSLPGVLAARIVQLEHACCGCYARGACSIRSKRSR